MRQLGISKGEASSFGTVFTEVAGRPAEGAYGRGVNRRHRASSSRALANSSTQILAKCCSWHLMAADQSSPQNRSGLTMRGDG